MREEEGNSTFHFWKVTGSWNVQIEMSASVGYMNLEFRRSEVWRYRFRSRGLIVEVMGVYKIILKHWRDAAFISMDTDWGQPQKKSHARVKRQGGSAFTYEDGFRSAALFTAL